MVRMMWLTRARSSALQSLASTRSSNASPLCRFRERPRTSLRRLHRGLIVVTTAIQRKGIDEGELWGNGFNMRSQAGSSERQGVSEVSERKKWRRRELNPRPR